MATTVHGAAGVGVSYTYLAHCAVLQISESLYFYNSECAISHVFHINQQFENKSCVDENKFIGCMV